MMTGPGPETLTEGERDRLATLCDCAQLNHCPNDPPCTEDDPLEVDDWCSLCLLVHDVRAILNGHRPTQATERKDK
jgi:hypothetical protein